MGNDIQKGTIYSEGGIGGAGTVNASNLNAHVDEARIKATFISSKTLKDPANLTDSLVVESSGALYRQTYQQVLDLITTTIETLLLPVGIVMDFAGDAAPDGWLFCFGQAVERTTYEDLFNLIGVTYGTGDGVNTFNIPDCRGRVIAGKDDMGGTAATRLQLSATANDGLANLNGVLLGAVGGNQRMQTHLHNYTYVNTPAGPGVQGGSNYSLVGTVDATGAPRRTQGAGLEVGSSGNVQPTIIMNKIIRALK